MTDGLARRLARRTRRSVGGVRRSRVPLPVATGDGAGLPPEVVVSHRIDRAARLRMLSLTTADLGRALAHGGLRVRIADASPPEWRPAVSDAWAQSGLDCTVERSDAPLVEAYDHLLTSTSADVFCLQFDDTISVGLSPSWLGAAASLVRRLEGVVVAPQWPLEVRTDDTSVEVVHHRARTRRPSQRYWLGGWQEPRALEIVDGHAFAVFDSFAYGFFFNNLVAPVGEFRERLGWYRANVDRSSAHAIELAAYEWRGPVWPFVAIPLDVALLDLDYDHTPSAVRKQAPDRELVCDLLERGIVPRVVTLKEAD